MDQIGSAVAADAINKLLVAPLIQQIDDVLHLDQNRGLLQDKLERMKDHLQYIQNAFENQQRAPAESIKRCLKRTGDAVREAEGLIVLSQRQQSCVDCLFCKPKISRQIREWITRFDVLFQELQADFSIFADVQTVSAAQAQSSTSAPAQSSTSASTSAQAQSSTSASTSAQAQSSTSAPAQSSTSAPLEEKDSLLQPVPDGGFIGSGIESAKILLQAWIDADQDPQLRMIGVYGMAGVGKTSLLQSVYNFYKVGNVFDDVIWQTISQDYKIPDLQNSIGKKIGLNFSITDDNDTKKMALSASLKNKKFLLILDDIWSALDLKELGVAFGTDKGSKVIFSTRNREIASAESDKSTEVKPLSMEQGWELFERGAFRGGHVPEHLKGCAREIANECKGLPLAITVVAAAMKGKNSEIEWNTSLSQMKIADPSFPETHPRVDKELYQKLRWSYDEMHKTPHLQNCFLYCAMYAEDEEIWVPEFVDMCIAEGFVKSKGGTYSMDTDLGISYVKILISRGLFQSLNFEKQSKGNVNKPVNVWAWKKIRVHDVIRDMAIYIGEKDGNYILRAGQQVKDFPESPSQECKRMSLRNNEIKDLPKELVCTQLVSLFLSRNPLHCNVPESFLMKLTSLRVLDLSNTGIQSVPASLGQLSSLRYLKLPYTKIQSVPASLGQLSSLRYLNLWNTEIQSVPASLGQLTLLEVLNLNGTGIAELPEEICNLTRLHTLDLMNCENLVLPLEICELSSLKKLKLDIRPQTNMMALKGLTNLIQLSVHIYSEFDADEIMRTWLEMRHVWLLYIIDVNTLPSGMQNLKKLQSLNVFDMNVLNLPNWICEFQQLERLELTCCDEVEELPPLGTLPNLKFLRLKGCAKLRDLGIGGSEKPRGFPRLERLDLIDLPKLQSMMRLSCDKGVLKEGTLSKLVVLKIRECPELIKLPIGIEKLSNLKALYGEKSWWEDIIWEDNNTKMYFHNLFVEI